MQFNFGDTPLKHLPSGYTPLSKANRLIQFQGYNILKIHGNNIINLTPSFPHLAPAAAKPSDGKKKQHVPMALIIEPARELAQQTFENIKLFKKFLPTPKLK